MSYNVSLGKGQDAQQISSQEIKSGVKKEDIKDERMRSIFNLIDNGNGILEESEIQKLNTAIEEAAAQDGDTTNLSNKEAKSLIKSLGLKGFKVEDLFKFLNAVKQVGVNIAYQTRDVEHPDEIVIKYKPDAEGNSVIERRSDKDGTLVGSIIQDKNNNTMIRDADNRISGGKNEVGKYQRTYNADGGYTDTYEDGSSKIYNQNGQIIGGKTRKGDTYTAVPREDGSYTCKYSDGEIQEYDKNGRQLSGTLANGTTFENEYHEDGSYTQKWSYGHISEYDKNGRELGAIYTNGTTFKNEYHEDGSYTRKWSSGQINEYDKNGRELHAIYEDGITLEYEYHEDGSYTKKYSDGRIQEYDKNERQLSGTLPDGTTFENKYHEDGSYTQKWSNGQIDEYDKNGRELRGTLGNGTTYEYKYGDDGKLKYKEFSEKDGSKYYYGADKKSYAEKTPNGNFKVSPKQGETFDDTMKRLGITDPADQEMFKKANPKAYKRGYFLLTEPGKAYGDVYIPKELADKLKIEDMLVDKTAEAEKHKQARKKPQMGV